MSGQPSLLETLQQATLDAMNRLNIRQRPNRAADAKLQFRYDPELDKKDTPAAFNHHMNEDGIKNSDDPDRLYYISPTIYTNAKVRDMVSVPPLVETKYYTYILSIIVHEITHYYQWTDDPLNKRYIKYSKELQNHRQYLTQRCELEAHAVQAQYYLENISSPQLNQILAIEDEDYKRRHLIDEFQLITLAPNAFD